MSIVEKLAQLEEIMDLDEGTLKPDDKLKEYDEWDSITILAFIAFMDSDFGKTVKGEEIKNLTTVQDVLDIME